MFRRLLLRLLGKCPVCEKSFSCTECGKTVIKLGLKSYDGKVVKCIECAKEEVANRVSQFDSLYGGSSWKTGNTMREYITDGGVVFKKDRKGDWFVKGKRVNSKLMPTLLKGQGKLHEAKSIKSNFYEMHR